MKYVGPFKLLVSVLRFNEYRSEREREKEEGGGGESEKVR